MRERDLPRHLHLEELLIEGLPCGCRNLEHAGVVNKAPIVALMVRSSFVRSLF